MRGFVVNHKRVRRLLRLMGLMAINPLYSRYIVGCGISNSLEAKASIAVMKQAVKDYGKPEIINSDQGIYALLQLRITSSRELTERLRRNAIRQHKKE
jgi:hypothetical protein